MGQRIMGLVLTGATVLSLAWCAAPNGDESSEELTEAYRHGRAGSPRAWFQRERSHAGAARIDGGAGAAPSSDDECFSLRVVDLSGAPVPDVAVVVSDVLEDYWIGDPVSDARGDADGLVEVCGPVSGMFIDAWNGDGGWTRWDSTMFDYRDDDEPIEVVFSPAARMLGTVRDEAGRPLAGVPLAIYTYHGLVGDIVGEPPYQNRELVENDSLVTDAEGRFDLSARIGVWSLFVGPTDTHRASHIGPVTVRVGQDTRLDITLRVGETISGIVVHADGTPVEGARITLRTDTASAGSSTDAAGRFSVMGFAPGITANVTVYGGESALIHRDTLTTGDHRIVLEAAGRLAVTIEADPPPGCRSNIFADTAVRARVIESREQFRPDEFRGPNTHVFTRVRPGTVRIVASGFGTTVEADVTINAGSTTDRTIRIAASEGIGWVHAQMHGLAEAEYAAFRLRRDSSFAGAGDGPDVCVPALAGEYHVGVDSNSGSAETTASVVAGQVTSVRFSRGDLEPRETEPVSPARSCRMPYTMDIIEDELWITQVRVHSGGLIPGDRIIAVDGEPFERGYERYEAAARRESTASESPITLTYLRDGARYSATIRAQCEDR